MNNSVDGLRFFKFIVSFQFSQLNANLLFTGVKYLLINKFTLQIPIAFLSVNFFLFCCVFRQCFLLRTRTITFFFFFPRRRKASISLEVTLTSVAFFICQRLFLLVDCRLLTKEFLKFQRYSYDCTDLQNYFGFPNQ